MKIKEIAKKNLPFLKLKYDKIIIKHYSKYDSKDYPIILKKWYRKNTGQDLNLEDPKNYTQKIQWLKLNDITQQKADLSDKYKVREWVSKKIGEEYLVPLLAGPIYDAKSINFDSLPEKFVIKTNHSSGWNIIVKDKNKINKNKIIRLLNEWLNLDFAFKSGFEMHYSLIKPCIIIEDYLQDIDGELTDYKFLCFDGKPYYCWVDVGRYKKHKRNIYDMNWNLQPWNQHNYGNSKINIERPKNFDKMVELASILCKGFNHVRVDFYNINGKIFFGEMTFTNGSGKELIVPEEYNIKLGKMLKINLKNKH